MSICCVRASYRQPSIAMERATLFTISFWLTPMRRKRPAWPSLGCSWMACRMASELGAALTLLFSVATFMGRAPLLSFLGASPETYAYAESYLFWVVVLGGVPTMVSLTLGHLLRSEGHAKQASAGMMFGGILNVVLDPDLIFGFHLDVARAAPALAGRLRGDLRKTARM